MLKAKYNGWERDDATVVMRLYEEWAGMDWKKAPAKKKGK
jgi:hypothetical protein